MKSSIIENDKWSTCIGLDGSIVHNSEFSLIDRNSKICSMQLRRMKFSHEKILKRNQLD